MATSNEKIIPVDIEEEMKGSYIDYSMSVIVARALPDVRDGLKPVHRRVLFGMNELGLAPNRAYKKSARIVGEVLGKYHPHGDSSVYDTIVRMAQDFSLRYPLVDGQGNFGSVDGDSPAAMRYTEVRLTRVAEELLKDIEKNTVNFTSNFDDTLKEPSVLPANVPNLLINGASGIAVGMTTNIPPHNLGEVIDGVVAMIADRGIDNEKLMKHIKAPDFPTGGIIYGYDGVREAYKTGRGKITLRAKATIETAKNDRQSIIVSEIPYQVNKATLIEKIAELVRDKKMDDVSGINDESDRDGMRIVIDLKRDANASVVLNNLYRMTQMQTTFGIIMLALVDGRPQVLQLKDTLNHFIEHRNEVVVRRTKFDLDAAEKRAHILEGYIIALDNIDAIIKLIKASKDTETAKQGLMKKFKLSEIQAQAILDMRLQRLTGLERKKIEDEYKELIKLINRLKSILNSKQLQMQIIKEELLAIKEKYGDNRRTEIVMKQTEFKIEDMIAEEEVVITISHGGYIKRFPVSGYRRQSRGGKGVTGAASREDDFVEHMFIASTHNYILFFTDKGKCYWLKVFEVPEGGRTSKGKAITNLIAKEAEENITAFLSVKEFSENQFVFMVTEEGQMKKTSLMEFSNPRKNGIGAISLDKHDLLRDVKLTDGSHELVIGTHEGIAIRFSESEVRAMGRSASGVRAIRLEDGDKVIGAVSIKRTKTTLLVVTENGFGKRSDLSEYRVSHRGGKGIATLRANEKTGKMIAIKEVQDIDDIVVVTSSGMVIRQRAEAIRVSGRNTSGVRLIRLNADDAVTAIAIVTSEDEEEKQLEAADKARASVPAPEENGETIEQNELFDDKKKALKKQKSETTKGKEKLISKNQKKSVPKKEEKPVALKKTTAKSDTVKQKPISKTQKSNKKKKGKK
ncbi:MAG: DNA gyrase subunit A [Bacteroidota bacterium]|nr:DNA gyrase subunit A [Bacteroidota bacterium]